MAAERGVKGPRNRPRARLVCSNCRSRKVKCDAEKLAHGPPCTPCQASKAKCHIDPDSDRRRHGTAHHRFAEMQERISSLEAMVKPQSSAQRSRSVSRNTQEISRSDSQPPSSPLIASHTQREQSSHDTISVPQSSQHSLPSPANAPSPQWQPRDLSASNRVSRIAATSQDEHPNVLDLPSWAPSANLSPMPNGLTPAVGDHVTQSNTSAQNHVNGVGDVPDSEDESMQVYQQPEEDEDSEIEMEFDCSQVTDINMESLQLQKTLLGIFFKVQPNTQIIVSEDLFRRDKKQCPAGQRLRYYSNFLESAMLASAARHSTSASVRALVRRYTQRAKDQITSELDHPNIATLQGFLILSDLEAIRGRARIGWTYCSIATGLLVDLALHVEPSESTSKNSVTQVDAGFRASLLLGTFVYATLWSLYLGRPSSISSLVLLSVRRVAESYPKDNTLYMWVQLCLRMLEIIEILNAPPSLRHLETNLRLCFYENSLRSAFENLPTELLLNDSHIEELEAAAYTPHIQHLGIQVTLNRAMIKAGLYQVRGRSDVQPKSLENIHATIHDHAIRIARLILSFQRMFGSENMVTVMLDNIYVAATALISHILRLQKVSGPIETDLRWLHFLLEALESMEKHFPIARRMRSSLGHMIKKTTIFNFFPNLVPSTPSTNAVISNITNLPTPQHNAVPPSSTSGISDVNLDFATEDDMWSHYLAWNMPFMPEVHEPGQFVAPTQITSNTNI